MSRKGKDRVARPPAERVLVLVLGMHRSGTSLITELIERWGFALGDELLPPQADNPRGFFEHAGIVAIHGALFEGLGLSWEDAQPLPRDWLASEAAQRALDRLGDAVGGLFERSARIAVKDPRACRFVPLWRKLAERMGFELRIVLAARHPAAAVASLTTRDGLAPDHVYLLWLLHVLESEAATRELPRALVTYEAMLRRDSEAIARLAALLGLAHDDPRLAQVDDLVDPSMQHHGDAGNGIDESPLAELAARTYATLTGDLPPDQKTSMLARVATALDAWTGLYAGAKTAVERRWHARYEAMRRTALHLDQASEDPPDGSEDPRRLRAEYHAALDFAARVVRQRVSDLEHGIFERNARLEAQRAEHEAAIAANTELAGRVQGLEAQRDGALEQLQRCESERAQLALQLQRETTARTQADARADAVQLEASNLREQVQQLTAQLADLRRSLDRSRDENAELRQSRERALEAALHARRTLDAQLRKEK
jgi:hypothetical protein